MRGRSCRQWRLSVTPFPLGVRGIVSVHGTTWGIPRTRWEWHRLGRSNWGPTRPILVRRSIVSPWMRRKSRPPRGARPCHRRRSGDLPAAAVEPPRVRRAPRRGRHRSRVLAWPRWTPSPHCPLSPDRQPASSFPTGNPAARVMIVARRRGGRRISRASLHRARRAAADRMLGRHRARPRPRKTRSRPTSQHAAAGAPQNASPEPASL